ncbi:hypothetical protein ACS0TY_029145 [Phlomoides rotata]
MKVFVDHFSFFPKYHLSFPSQVTTLLTNRTMDPPQVSLIFTFLCFIITFNVCSSDRTHFTDDTVSMNCGSTGTSSAYTGTKWLGDVQPRASPLMELTGSSTTSTASSKPTSADPVPYKTARVSRSHFSYAFQVNPGQKIIRLHFNPSPYRGFKGLKDLFTVEAGPFTLLGNFSASLTANALRVNSLTKEFCLNIQENQLFHISYSAETSQSKDAYAFINGIEIISVPAIYKGFIDKERNTVAVKRLKSNSSQGAREFLTEIETLSELRHINLVSLIGYCSEHGEMILVYEYMSCGTLGDHLYNFSRRGIDASSLTWKQRLNICIGAARGLDYLHTGHRVIHRDVKASNILLDDSFVAKVSDFGLAKAEDRSKSQSHVSTKVKGTHGYLDPHYYSTRKLTRKSDTYAFGVVLLEVLCGRAVVDFGVSEEERMLTMWARDKIRKGEVDQIVALSLRDEISPNSLKTFVGITERCLDDYPKNRPTMSQVVLQLEFALEQQGNKNLRLNEVAIVSDDIRPLNETQGSNTALPTVETINMQSLTLPLDQQTNNKVFNSYLLQLPRIISPHQILLLDKTNFMLLLISRYMAPEYFIYGKVSVKADVYSFEIILLEIVNDTKFFPIDDLRLEFLEDVWKLWTEGRAIDLVDDSMDASGQDEAIRCIQVALLCIQEHLERPTMLTVIKMLEGNEEMMQPHPPALLMDSIAMQ